MEFVDLFLPSIEIENGTLLDEPIKPNSSLLVWHVGFMGLGVFFSVVVMLCCCFRFRIPRTKQDIEADYQRRILARKFREKLEEIKNSDMENVTFLIELDAKKMQSEEDMYGGGQETMAGATGALTTKESARLIENRVKPKKKDGLRV